MKNEYNFTGGVRGKFYHDNISIKLPIYLNSENMLVIQEIAEKNKMDPSTVANELIKKSLDLENSRVHE